MGWRTWWRGAGKPDGGFSARLFPLPRGWLTPLDSSGGRMEYLEIPTAATALRFCARGYLLPHVAVHGRSWLLVAVHGRSWCSSSAPALPGCDGCLCATQAFATRSEAAGWARHGVWLGSPDCRLPRLQSGLAVPVSVEIRSRWKVPPLRASPGNRSESGGVSHR